MTGSPAALRADWLGACRAATSGLRDILGAHPTTRERVEETGERGEGGDRTLVIDQAVEDRVFAELDKLYAGGARFRAVSEERGSVDFGSEDVLVIIDPIDGSLNAKRGFPHIGISIAVAEGPTMADVVFGYVADIGTGEEWVASRGEGVLLNGAPAPPAAVEERRGSDGRLEVVSIESADPRWLAPAMDGLEQHVHRIRAVGSMAISLCHVSLARVDGLLTLWRTRAVDCAAGQLIVRESGGKVAFLGYEELSAPLDLEPRAPLVAARSERGLAVLTEIVESSRR